MARKKHKARRQGDTVTLEMTPMIDVVFQLLIFFLVTLKQEDILSRLDVSRPAPDDTAVEDTIKDMLTVTVHKYGFMLKKQIRTLNQLEQELARFASFDPDVSVVIRCTPDSRHRDLVALLDLCAKVGLNNLSVFSI